MADKEQLTSTPLPPTRKSNNEKSCLTFNGITAKLIRICARNDATQRYSCIVKRKH